MTLTSVETEKQPAERRVKRYLGRTEVALHLGFRSIIDLEGVELPTHDAEIYERKGWLPSTIDEWREEKTAIKRRHRGRPKKRRIHKYLGRTEVAKHLGMKSIRSLSGVVLPAHDAEIGDRKGWTVATIDQWAASRPGKGRWGARIGQTRTGMPGGS